MEAYWENGGIDPHILDFDTINFDPRGDRGIRTVPP
jgi:hypothetical protein